MTTVNARAPGTANPLETLDRAFRQAITAALGAEHAGVDPQVRASQRPEMGDFQANFAMGLARKLGRKPRDVAAAVVQTLDLGDLAEPPEVAGPGFVNIRLRSDALAGMLETMDGPPLGVAPAADRHAVAIDLCGVNVSKQMHVGHLRSTIIGDALARVFERVGRPVHRENHLGDWGVPIAMVLHELRARGIDWDTLQLSDLDAHYRDAQLAARADERGLARAREFGAGPHRIAELEAQNASAADATTAAKATLVALQAGDEDLRRDWHRLIDCTLSALEESLTLLDVTITREHDRGESFYRDRLPGVVDAFVGSGLAVEDQGAIVVRFEDRARPLLIRKSDGGFLYATTDLAAVRFRVHELGATRVIYVVDARQRDHFRDVFDAARLIGWDRTPDGATAELIHVPFGAVLGPDRKPLKTRAGRNVTLRSLLEESAQRGTEEVKARAQDPNAPTHGLSAEELAEIGRLVGIGAVKYADLSNDLVRDYEFDFDRMIAFEGNTGPYIQYAHARICSIFARSGVEAASFAAARLLVREPAEKQLALTLLQYGQVVHDTARTLEPHRLCTYLYELANVYSAFYQACPVLKADDDATRRSRLRLCDLTRRVLADGLGLLGISAPRRM